MPFVKLKWGGGEAIIFLCRPSLWIRESLPKILESVSIFVVVYAVSLPNFPSQTNIHIQMLHCHCAQWSEWTCNNRVVALAPFEKPFFSAAASDFSVEMLFLSTSMNYVELPS